MRKIMLCVILAITIASCSAINRMMIPYEEHQACNLKGQHGLCGSVSEVYKYTENKNINNL